MSRHPYTHAADFIRALGPVNESGVVLSRSNASEIRKGIAEAIGMKDEELAIKLSEAQQSKSEKTVEKEGQRLLEAIMSGR